MCLSDMCKIYFDGGKDDEKQEANEPGQPSDPQETPRAGRDTEGFTRELEEKTTA